MKKYLLIIIAFLIVGCPVAFAQVKITVKGVVTDAASKEKLAGVSVRVKGKTGGTATDANGRFTITALSNDVLELSYTGYKLAAVAIGGHTTLDVSLESNIAQLNEVVLIGTRSGGRAKLETPVPVDVVNIAKASATTGRLDLTDILNYAAPSFNYNKQSGSDGADHVELGTLRGLGPDQTLVLINGKRRHQTAFVSVFGTRGRGNSGTDLSSIPTSAIDRVEILRDGASAQYGSDAIAGVINLVLKRNINQLTVNAGYAGYYDPAFNTRNAVAQGQYPHGGAIDGNAVTLDANYGLAIGKHNGFINFSANYANNGKTYRQTHDTAYANPKSLPLNTVRRANGDGSANSIDLFFNSEIPLASTRTTFYSFGGYSRKNSDDYAFTRNFSGSSNRFPTDASGNIIQVPGIINPTADGDYYFNPIIQTHNTDASLAMGFKGVLGKDVDWDLSNTLGNNSFHFYGDKTFNASLGAGKTHFDDGGPQFLQNTTNLNFNKHIGSIFDGLNIGAGAEYRYERYKIIAGEPDSYSNYNEDKATGSQGFPGYQPSDAVNAHRTVEGVYLDLEADVTKKWLIDFANRLEHYSDFGYNFNTKFATRYKITDNFNLRGSVGTGFRAPSLQQINYSSSYTNVQGGVISEVKIAPNYSPITKAAGIPTLKQEKSTNAGIGFTYKPIPELSITTDAYLIKVKDRVVLSGQFSADDDTLDPNFTAALTALHVTAAQFFANAVNTTNKGLDVVIEYNKTVGYNRFRLLFTGNFQNMKIDKINYPPKLSTTDDLKQIFLSDREQKFILASAPPQKLSLNPEYGYKKFTVGTRFTYFGKIVLLGYGQNFDGLNPQVPLDKTGQIVPDQYNYTGKVVSDLYFTYKLSKVAHVSIGSDNIFNLHPELGVVQGAKANYAFNNEPGGPFDPVQMGQNGRRLYVRVGFNF
ncbi:TonB-dependent receptor [Mucilaginibacter polytrichastri]|uniref:TonB-dependent receptor n=2 Tax=Mucilaginibacter polytrichastri TaxID=1302689 RepID=UPI0008E5A400|nr:TonB-dependent receptor [Mucilaginibacter polytrichastri]SFS48981.1 iron complex outermembrane recepter protein [Mucilaginibacter polytrichastri]